VRHRDIHLLTVGVETYTSDQRFVASHFPHTEDWTLQVKYPQRRDSGTYECQVSTTPPIGHSMLLSVVGQFSRPLVEFLSSFSHFRFSSRRYHRRSFRSGSWRRNHLPPSSTCTARASRYPAAFARVAAADLPCDLVIRSPDGRHAIQRVLPTRGWSSLAASDPPTDRLSASAVWIPCLGEFPAIDPRADPCPRSTGSLGEARENARSLGKFVHGDYPVFSRLARAARG